MKLILFLLIPVLAFATVDPGSDIGAYGYGGDDIGAYDYEDGTTVCAKPSISNITFTCTAGVSISYQMTVSNADSVKGSLPTGLSISNTGLITGSATTAGEATEYTLTAYHCSGDSTVTAIATITVVTCDSRLAGIEVLDSTAKALLVGDTLKSGSGTVYLKIASDTTGTVTLDSITGKTENDTLLYVFDGLQPSTQYFVKDSFECRYNSNWVSHYTGDSSDTIRWWYEGGDYPTTFTITLNTVGSGTVAQSPSGTTHDSGTVIRFTATPAEGFLFAGYTDSLVSTESEDSLVLNSNKIVTATFLEIPLDDTPNLISVSPSEGMAGSDFVMLGANMEPVGTIRLGDSTLPIVRISETEDTIYTAVPSDMPVGIYTVYMQWPEGLDSLENGFTVTNRPVITSVQTPVRVGKTCRIGGAQNADTVKLGSVVQTVSSTNDTSGVITPTGVNRGNVWLKLINASGRDSLVVYVKQTAIDTILIRR